ncbi:MAG: AAA family ATPase, partial [Bacteroidales bacterium]|nr:AAA family ATPase [Bacteroidales bacterium]
MKILVIRGKNLASLEGEFVIDFNTEPLKSAGIFAITGSTGSGKSTLLDALCLALFDETPRTSRALENISMPDVKEKTINQKDSRTILRRGTSDG